MWEINNGLQIIGLLRAALFGVIFALIYDILRALRRVNAFSDFAVFLQDILYFIIVSPILFFLLLSLTNGEMRLYVFIGVIIGFVFIRLTVSKIFCFLLEHIFCFLNMILLNIGKGIDFIIEKTGHFILSLGYNLRKILLLFIKKEKRLEKNSDSGV